MELLFGFRIDAYYRDVLVLVSLTISNSIPYADGILVCLDCRFRHCADSFCEVVDEGIALSSWDYLVYNLWGNFALATCRDPTKSQGGKYHIKQGRNPPITISNSLFFRSTTRSMSYIVTLVVSYYNTGQSLV